MAPSTCQTSHTWHAGESFAKSREPGLDRHRCGIGEKHPGIGVGCAEMFFPGRAVVPVGSRFLIKTERINLGLRQVQEKEGKAFCHLSLSIRANQTGSAATNQDRNMGVKLEDLQEVRKVRLVVGGAEDESARDTPSNFLQSAMRSFRDEGFRIFR